MLPAQPSERNLPDPETSPREFNVLLLGLIDHRCDLATLLSIHNLRIRDLAAWLRLPATQQALQDIEFITAIRNKHIALEQSHSALSALAAMIHSDASPETRRKAAGAILRADPTPRATPRATAGRCSERTAVPPALDSNSRATEFRGSERTSVPPHPNTPPFPAFRFPSFRLSPRLTPTRVPSRISLRARTPRQPAGPDAADTG